MCEIVVCGLVRIVASVPVCLCHVCASFFVFVRSHIQFNPSAKSISKQNVPYQNAHCSCKRSALKCWLFVCFCVLVFLFHTSYAGYWASVHSWPQTNSALNLNGKFTMIFALFRFSATVANQRNRHCDIPCTFFVLALDRHMTHSLCVYIVNYVGTLCAVGSILVFYCGYYIRSSNKCTFWY